MLNNLNPAIALVVPGNPWIIIGPTPCLPVVSPIVREF